MMYATVSQSSVALYTGEVYLLLNNLTVSLAYDDVLERMAKDERTRKWPSSKLAKLMSKTGHPN